MLTPKGWKDVIYNVQSSTRVHVSASVIVNAAGKCVSVRLVYPGVKNVAKFHLRNLIKTGLSGEWVFSVSEKGFMTRIVFLEVLLDLDNHLTANNIQRPVVLILDGFSGHTGLGKFDI